MVTSLPMATLIHLFNNFVVYECFNERCDMTLLDNCYGSITLSQTPPSTSTASTRIHSHTLCRDIEGYAKRHCNVTKRTPHVFRAEENVHKLVGADKKM